MKTQIPSRGAFVQFFEKKTISIVDSIIEEIKESTRADEESQAIIATIKDDLFSNNLRQSVKPFKKLAYQLTIEDGLIILDGHCIVVPRKRSFVWLFSVIHCTRRCPVIC